MDQTTREHLIARFADYLDRTAEADDAQSEDTQSENAGSGDTDEVPDLFTLLAEVTALKNEVKIESRQMKGALDQFRDVFGLVSQAQTRLEEGQTQRLEAERRARQDAERDLLRELLDLRDRLQAGYDQARRYHPGWLPRHRKSRVFVAAMAEGLGMNLRRLDDTLARRGIQPLRVQGQRFDPQTMHATEVAQDPTQTDGIVLAELRRGFTQGDRLLRPAEVVVNRLAEVEA